MCGCQDFYERCGKGPTGKASGFAWTHGTVCACAQRSTCLNVPGKYGPHGELLFFLVKKELVAVSNDVSSNPFVSAETPKACALICLHLLAAEGEAGSCGSQSPRLSC